MWRFLGKAKVSREEWFSSNKYQHLFPCNMLHAEIWISISTRYRPSQRRLWRARVDSGYIDWAEVAGRGAGQEARLSGGCIAVSRNIFVSPPYIYGWVVFYSLSWPSRPEKFSYNDALSFLFDFEFYLCPAPWQH